MVFALLILLFGVYAYTIFYGVPWEKKLHENKMQEYLMEKYELDFVLLKMSYNYLSETYQGYAYPKGYSDFVFMVEEDLDAVEGYSDNYPKVIWESHLSIHIKAKMKELFPSLDESTFKALQIKDKGEVLGPDIPSYEEINVSLLESSIPIDIHDNWAQKNQQNEIKKMNELSKFLQANHFPILVEVRYFEGEMNENAKVFFITEDGKIIDK